VDELDKATRPLTGRGGALRCGRFLVRDPKGTVSQADDAVKLVSGAASHELVLVDSSQTPWRYRAKDETFCRSSTTRARTPGVSGPRTGRSIVRGPEDYRSGRLFYDADYRDS